MGICESDLCDLDTVKGSRFCRLHVKLDAKNKGPQGVRYVSPFGRLHEAALALAHAEDDGEYRNARQRLRDAAKAYTRKR